jgi:hypothetical protein
VLALPAFETADVATVTDAAAQTVLADLADAATVTESAELFVPITGGRPGAVSVVAIPTGAVTAMALLAGAVSVAAVPEEVLA